MVQFRSSGRQGLQVRLAFLKKHSVVVVSDFRRLVLIARLLHSRNALERDYKAFYSLKTLASAVLQAVSRTLIMSIASCCSLLSAHSRVLITVSIEQNQIL